MVGLSPSWTEVFTKILIDTRKTNIGQANYIAPNRNWIHAEVKYVMPSTSDYHVSFWDAGGAANTCFIDNIYVTAAGGPSRITHGHHLTSMPGF